MNPFTQDIILTHFDHQRLQGLARLLRARGPTSPWNIDALELGLEHAQTVPADAIPRDVITMNSRLTVRNTITGERTSLTLVFPHAAVQEPNRISILSPLGLALLGSRVGDTLEHRTSTTSAPLTIESIDYQPEAKGNYYM